MNLNLTLIYGFFIFINILLILSILYWFKSPYKVIFSALGNLLSNFLYLIAIVKISEFF